MLGALRLIVEIRVCDGARSRHGRFMLGMKILAVKEIIAVDDVIMF